MIRLFCPLFYARLILNAAKAIDLFIRHDATLLRVEELLQKSQDDANRSARDAAASLTDTDPAVLAEEVLRVSGMETAKR